MKPTKILTFFYPDLKIPSDSRQIKTFYNEILGLIGKNIEKFESKGISTEIFHNELITYTGIQFARYQEAASFTGIGKMEVEAIEILHRILKKKYGIGIMNTVKIQEEYRPSITIEYFNYKTDNLLVKKEIDKEITLLKNKFAVHDRLEKYLYGNIKAFLTRVAGMDIGEGDYISIKVNSYKRNGFADIWKNAKLRTYEIEFDVNIYLPQTLRLGQCVALGYGEIKHISDMKLK